MAKICKKSLLVFALLFYNLGSSFGQNFSPKEVYNVTKQFSGSEKQDGGESDVETTTTAIIEGEGDEVSTTGVSAYTNGGDKAVKQISVFKCINSSLEGETFTVPIWLRQFLSPDREDKLMEDYGEYFYNFKLQQASFHCSPSLTNANTDGDGNSKSIINSNPTEFYFEKNETEGRFLSLKTKSPHSINTKMNGFFLPNGYLKYNFEGVNYYYPPGSYCVKSANQDEVEGFFCSQNFEMTQEGLAPTPPVIPQIRKCLALGYLLYLSPREGALKLFEVKEAEDEEWEPFMYENTRKASQKNIMPIYTQSRINCSAKILVVTDPEILPYMETITYSGLRIMENGAALGRIKGSGKWEDLGEFLNLREFCIDGYIDINDNENGNNSVYYKRQDRQIIIGCQNIPVSTSFSLIDAYAYVMFIPTLLLLIILVIYALVWTNQNIHGRTSAAFVFSMFIYFCTLILSNVKVFTFGSPYCAANGMIAHYFYLAMFYWMAIMNFDVWNTIRSMVAVSQRSKGNKRFLLYCCVAFGIPAIVLTISIIFHNTYRIDEESVILPLYGYYACNVDKTVQLYYNLCPVAFVFITSIIFGLMTMYTLYKLKKDTKRIETSSTKNSQKQYEFKLQNTSQLNKSTSPSSNKLPNSSPGPHNNASTSRPLGTERRPVTNSKLYANYRWHVILKLFLLTGVSWFSDLIYNIWYPDAVWYFFILDCYNFCQAFFLFSIFVCKPEIRNQLAGNYDCFKKLFEFWDNNSSKVPIVGSTKRSKADNNRSQAFDSSTYTTNSETR